MRQAAAWAGKTLGFIALGAYPLLIHAALTSSGQWATPAAAVISLQFVVVGALVLVRSTYKYKWLVAAVALLVLAASWHSAQQSLLAVSGVSHAIINLGLLALFAGSLLPGQEPIVSALARKIRGSLPGDMPLYTRRVTWAWSFFFAAQLLISLVLFLYAPVSVWSLFVNVLNAPLIVLMFAVEYGYRVVRFREYHHASIADVVRAFKRRDAAVSKPADLG
jgi:uncharacterized membrane protein